MPAAHRRRRSGRPSCRHRPCPPRRRSRAVRSDQPRGDGAARRRRGTGGRRPFRLRLFDPSAEWRRRRPCADRTRYGGADRRLWPLEARGRSGAARGRRAVYGPAAGAAVWPRREGKFRAPAARGAFALAAARQEFRQPSLASRHRQFRLGARFRPWRASDPRRNLYRRRSRARAAARRYDRGIARGAAPPSIAAAAAHGLCRNSAAPGWTIRSVGTARRRSAGRSRQARCRGLATGTRYAGRPMPHWLRRPPGAARAPDRRPRAPVAPAAHRDIGCGC